MKLNTFVEQCGQNTAMSGLRDAVKDLIKVLYPKTSPIGAGAAGASETRAPSSASSAPRANSQMEQLQFYRSVDPRTVSAHPRASGDERRAAFRSGPPAESFRDLVGTPAPQWTVDHQASLDSGEGH
ncbi:hypothetical protein EBR96_01115, partial [bacterium]|nr:hypothetical protein [bacterium]